MTRRDRDILRQKVAALAAKGPGGWWRIAKNLTRYGLGVGQEHPVTPEFWQAALRDAGFTDVIFRPVVAEAGIVRGIRGLSRWAHRAGLIALGSSRWAYRAGLIALGSSRWAHRARLITGLAAGRRGHGSQPVRPSITTPAASTSSTV
jgi:hypothetical protein